MRSFIIRFFILLGLLFPALYLIATPASAAPYTDNGDGTVTDTATGLTWMRCAMGQTWDGSTCTGTAGTYTWAQATALTSTFAGKSDWRLPNVRELQTIVDRSRYSPAIDPTAFPNITSSVFWSGSPNANGSGLAGSSLAWYVHFINGYANYDFKSYPLLVRLVRGGQSLGSLADARPDADYTDNGDGTVTHKPSGLMWKKCSEGQTGSACTGTASTFTWDQAMALTSTFAGKSDWRLPTADELLSMTDYTQYNPAINVTLFPGTPASGFWSGSPDASNSGNAWNVYFGDGSNYSYSKGNPLLVRLVRGGQSLGSLSAQTIGAISFSPNTLTVGGTTTASATATSGMAVTFTSMTPSVCTVSGSTVTAVAAGTCTIAADQTGNGNYNAATQVTQSFSVSAQAAPAVSLSLASLTFTNQNIGVTSAVQTVTLTNSGTVALNITGIAASGDFAQSNNCGASVAAGASCTLTITFTPTVAGARTDVVTITSNAATSPSTISLSGTGVAVPTVTLNFSARWNLVGNSVNAPLPVVTTFGDATKVSTVWKWLPATSKWAFYTPLQTDGGVAYAATKGYDVLTTINGGEGYWVNAKIAFTAQLPAGTAVTTASFQDKSTPPNPLPTGWSLISVSGNPTPVAFNNGIGLAPPATGTIAPNLTTLWAWDGALSNWYFYAPSLDANGTLATYITGKNYLNFGVKTLDPTMGFWVNRPASGATGGGSTTTATAEGFWIGTSSTGYNVALAVLENGETWGLYSSGNTIYGALFGNTSISGNSLSGTGTDYNIPARTATPGSYSGTVTSKASIAVTTSSGSSFNGTYRSLYDQSPSLASLAGTYSGYGVSGTSTTQYFPVTVSSAGAVSAGSQALGCTVSGSVTPRASGKNVYNLSVTFSGINCALGNGTTTTGIAILDATVTPNLLYAMALKSDKSDGFIWTGTR